MTAFFEITIWDIVNDTKPCFRAADVTLDVNCFEIVYGNSGSDCFSSRLFQLLFLCWWHTDPRAVWMFQNMGAYNRRQVAQVAREFRDCVVEKSDRY
ncbi:hypothetical protein MTO96_012621 [Rhipicephalus appendiculatus]